MTVTYRKRTVPWRWGLTPAPAAVGPEWCPYRAVTRRSQSIRQLKMPLLSRHSAALLLVVRFGQVGERREQTTLSCSLKSRQRSSVGKPVVILGNRKVLLARLTNWLGRRSNAVPDDFINRFAGRTAIKVIVRCGRHGTRASSSISLGSKRKGAGDLPAPQKLAHPLVTTGGGGGGSLPLPIP